MSKQDDVKELARKRVGHAAALQSQMIPRKESDNSQDNSDIVLSEIKNKEEIENNKSTVNVETSNPDSEIHTKSIYKRSGKKGIRDTHYPTTYQVVNEMRAWIQSESDTLGREAGKGFIKAFVNTALFNAYESYIRGDLELNEEYADYIIQHFEKSHNSSTQK